MNRPKFTPGPWKVIPATGYNRRIAISAKGAEKYSSRGPIALVGKRHKTAMANASLIAAAPEMYSELEYFIDLCERTDCEMYAAVAKKILRKARGEE